MCEKLTSVEVDKNMLENEWYILPVANPDGYIYSHTVHKRIDVLKMTVMLYMSDVPRVPDTHLSHW